MTHPPKRLRVALPILLAAVAIGIWQWRSRAGRDLDGLSASGTIEATSAQLGFQVAGRIDSLHVREGDRVTAGTVLASLDRSERQARRAQAVAQLEGAGAALSELERGARSEEVQQARAARDAARARLADASRDVERAQKLFDGGAVSRETLDKAMTSRDVADKQLSQAEEQLHLVEAGPRRERIEGARAQRALADATLSESDAALANMVLRAPFDGVVTIRHREPGEIVAPGSAVVTLLNRSDRWVRIYVPENRIGAVHLGSPAQITSDTYPDRTYGGVVVFVASEAEFTPKNVQTTEERVKLVYAVKVRIEDDPRDELKPGMAADVRLATAP